MEQDVFNEHVIRYLAKLEVEIQALHRALELQDEGLPISESQMTVYRAMIVGQESQACERIRREFGLLL